MSEMTAVIDSLEVRIRKLVQRIEQLELDRARLRQELQQSSQAVAQKQAEIGSLKQQYETLKIANSLLGSEENKRDTKLKINSLIREIDYCIAQLADCWKSSKSNCRLQTAYTR